MLELAEVRSRHKNYEEMKRVSRKGNDKKKECGLNDVSWKVRLGHLSHADTHEAKSSCLNSFPAITMPYR